MAETGTEVEKLYSIVESIKTAMLVTRRADGHLRARAMATQKRAGGADLWFVTMEGSTKLVEIENDPHVNLSYHRDKNEEWVSISGTAIISRDRNKIRELYMPDWKIWFDDQGDPLHGTADDPRMVLIGVTIHAAEFLEVNKPRPVLLFEMVKGFVTGEEPEFGEMHRVSPPRQS
jgi:general stress protein 26